MAKPAKSKSKTKPSAVKTAGAAKRAAAKATKKKPAAKRKTAKKKPAAKKKATAKKPAAKKASKKATKKKPAAKKASKKKATKKKATKKKATKKKATKKKPAAKKKATAKKATARGRTTGSPTVRAASGKSAAEGKQLVIVESPAKARTINKYLGDEFVVRASVGHIRDLPSRAPKGVKQPVPGVDLEHDFKPTYEVLGEKTKTVAELKRDARGATEVWFATDLDREGEAIAWHLAEVLEVNPKTAKRVVFNAITKKAITRAFSKPRGIDIGRVNAQQARRILDRIVGYQASPLLWKKVARGLSAGRVQSVAVRMVVEREREIDAFTPDESWRVLVRLSEDTKTGPLAKAWAAHLGELDAKGKGPTLRVQNAWMSEHAALRAELSEIDGKKFSLTTSAEEASDLSARIKEVAEACGLGKVKVVSEEDPEGKGPARFKRSVQGSVAAGVRYAVRSVETRKTSSRPSGPFITSSLQIAASTFLGFSAQRTMRLAQDLYEGVTLGKEGQIGLITYMRTDSTNISDEAMTMVRGYVGKEFGDEYLSDKPKIYNSSNKGAQEAHEAIRPTSVHRNPEAVRKLLKGPRAEDQYKLYKLIWSRFVACQMAPAKWNSTAVAFERQDKKTGAVVRSTGRTLAFAGFYKVTGVPTATDEQTLPKLSEGDEMHAFAVEPKQRFSSPPPRYSEASLVKGLEAEGIGRPSTYASIIEVIQRRNYVEQRERRFYATDLGEVVTDKLIEAFPRLMSTGYTREMEGHLDEVEESRLDWVDMLRNFYGAFSSALEVAHESMTHAKAEMQPAIYRCPECQSRTAYRFGRNGRFLSCSTFPECKYASPIDRQGRPLLPERVDIMNPEDGEPMELRNGRFGPFLASINYPESKFVLNIDKKRNIKYPSIPPVQVTEAPCPRCDAPANLRRGKRGPWLGCSTFPKCRGRVAMKSLDEKLLKKLEKKLAAHEAKHPPPPILRADGSVVADGTPVAELLVQGGVAQLEVHPEAAAEIEESA